MRFPAGLLVLLTAGLGLDVASALAAEIGKPRPWQMNLQDAATPMMHQMASFHSFLLILTSLIAAFVLTLLVIVIVRYNAGASPIPSKTTHNTAVEVLWTVVPILILVVIAVPSFRLLYLQRVIPAADMTVKITGNKWYWSYEYPDHGGISFDSNILSDQEAEARGEPRKLAVDNPMVVPLNKTVRIIVTASDVIHAWTIPSFGPKMDAVPGRLNEDWFNVEIPGVYYGQCSELCGKDHAFMPITVHAVPESKFNAWVEKAKAAGIEEATKMLAGLRLSRRKLAGAAGAENY
jgi:cytochrome c oxidase subunit II